ncbi:MAG: glycosyltransferase family 4 protein [Bacteroidetes bacterium]|nr:glycosyltransferase family 4 protein [Bacteroidota bacterium]
MSKKVLIFTYYWPPSGGIAVQRFLKFSKYLPQFGWEPIIITVKNGSYPYFDESLEKEVPPDLRVYKTKTFEPFLLYNLLKGKQGKSLPTVEVGSQGNKTSFQKISEFIRANYFIPDARKGWIPYAVKQAEEVLKNEKIAAIITTGPPHSTHLIGLQLKKKFGVKWLADFRDPWTGIIQNQMLPRTASTIAKDESLESEVLQSADTVTVISEGMKEKFEDRTRSLQVIYNGYDDERFSSPSQALPNEKGFLFTYTGNFLASQNVPQLWDALAELKSECPELKLLLIGRVDKEVQKSIEKAEIKDLVVYKDFMPHSEVVSYMWHSSLLLFLLANVEDNKLLMTGKVFEYLPTGTELMGIGPVDGSAQDVMKTANRNSIIDYSDKESMKQRIQSAYHYWNQHGKAGKHSGDEYKQFAASNITRQLARLLEDLVT